MNRLLLVVLALVLMLPMISFAGWRDVLEGAERADKLIGRPAPAPAAEPAEQPEEAPAPPPRRDAAPRTAPSSGADVHFIQPDDYFIGEHELGDHTWMFVTLSKMVTKPSAATKDEGEFMTVAEGKNIWTNIIWQSRIASQDELKLGLHVIIFHDNNDKIYKAPKKKDQARNRRWWMAKITDMSDLYKGYLTVSGGYKVAPNNLRIPIRYGTSDR